tara:strand:+ start:863 stop:1138 length:276 start_codon:yes stop_codon:yes gene_type:complete
MARPFKMKGSPMKRNFGIGSPLRDHEKDSEGQVIEHPKQDSAEVERLRKEGTFTEINLNRNLKSMSEKLKRKRLVEDTPSKPVPPSHKTKI